VTFHTRDIDRGWKKAMRQFQTRTAVVEVGILGDNVSATDEGTDKTVAEIMTFHEFGQGVPRRSWLRDWFDEHQPQIRKMYIAIGSRVAGQHVSIAQGLEQFGTWLVGDLQKRWAQGIPPPNADSTAARKGSSTPLIDTGQSRSSVAHRVKIS
jgi:hypothetical protein